MPLTCLPRQPHGDVLATVRRYAVFDKSVDVLVWLGKQFEADDNDLLREMVRCFAEGLMGAESDPVCGADYGQISPQPWLRLRSCGHQHRGA